MTEDMSFFEISYSPSRRRVHEKFYFPNVSDHVVNVVRQTGEFYENDLLTHLYDTVPRTGTVIDVGANVGNHVLFWSRFLAKKVLAIEPYPRNADVLRSALKQNAVSNVEVLSCAVSDRECLLRLGLPLDHVGNPGAICNAENADVIDVVEVQAFPLDACVQRCLSGQDRVSLIKIDVEGAEETVIRGALEVLRQHRPHIVVECHTVDVLERVKELLSPFRYRMLGRWCASPTYHFVPWGAAKHLYWRACRKVKYVLGIKRQSL